MKKFFLNNIRRLRNDEEGVTLVEYGIALVLAVSVGTLALSTLATDVKAEMGDASAVLKKDDV